jgi:hypothetical protein
MTLDDVVPHPQYRMCHSRVVDAPPTAVWDELCRVTMSALPVGYALEGIRLLPARLAGRKHQSLAGRTFLDVTPIPVLFSERPQVVISAGLSQAWRLLGGQTPPRLDAAALRAWSQPGWIKVAMEFRFEPIPAGTLLSTETRILATDPGTRRSFAAYWFLIRPSSSAIRCEVVTMGSRGALRWVIAVVVVLGVVALLAWRRNSPGVGDRFPDESRGRVTIVVPHETGNGTRPGRDDRVTTEER